MRRNTMRSTILALPLFMVAGCVGTTPPGNENVGPGDIDPCELRGDEGCSSDDPSTGSGQADDDDATPLEARVIAELPVMGASASLDDRVMDCTGLTCDRAVNEARTYTLSAVATNRLFVDRQVSVSESGEYAYDWAGEGMQCLTPNGFYVGEEFDYPDVATFIVDGRVSIGFGNFGVTCTGNTFSNGSGTITGTISEDLATITIRRENGGSPFTEILTKRE